MQHADLLPPGTPPVLAPPAPNVRRLAALCAEGREALWREHAEEGAPVACEVCGAEDLDRWDTGQTWGETLCEFTPTLKLFDPAHALLTSGSSSGTTACTAITPQQDPLATNLAVGTYYARVDIAKNRSELAKLNARLKALDPRIYAADQSYKFAKASFDAGLYKYEDALANSPRSGDPRTVSQVRG